ncbi:AccA3 [Mycobacteroides abscessus subsp. abscessus]|nr:AccA3 [Mycobacteroides abscessus subsp. abscessus]
MYREPAGPGVRVDSGVVQGSVIGGQFDSMLAKLIVYGENRTQALERARRALAEFEVEGLATVIPFHRAIVEHPAFIGDGEKFDVYTKWIETKPKPRKRGGAGGGAASGDAVTAPMQGTVVKVAVEEGQSVEAGDLIVVLEAMKMENPVNAHKAGVVTGLAVEAGAAITQGTVLAEIK